MLIGVFLVLHIANHLSALGGQQAHIETMTALRPLYRNAIIEPVLLGALAWQICSGATMIIRGRHSRRGFVAWAQVTSGVYIAVFLAIHLTAIINGRLQGYDTNFNFAAAGMHAGAGAFFVPYYFLSVVAVSTHVACAVYWSWRTSLLPVAITALGTGIATVIVALLAGVVVPVTIPPAYLASYA